MPLWSGPLGWLGNTRRAVLAALSEVLFPPPQQVRLLENGEARLTEDGDFRITQNNAPALGTPTAAPPYYANNAPVVANGIGIQIYTPG